MNLPVKIDLFLENALNLNSSKQFRSISEDRVVLFGLNNYVIIKHAILDDTDLNMFSD
jgi:hypothetical protein